MSEQSDSFQNEQTYFSDSHSATEMIDERSTTC